MGARAGVVGDSVQRHSATTLLSRAVFWAVRIVWFHRHAVIPRNADRGVVGQSRPGQAWVPGGDSRASQPGSQLALCDTVIAPAAFGGDGAGRYIAWWLARPLQLRLWRPAADSKRAQPRHPATAARGAASLPSAFVCAAYRYLAARAAAAISRLLLAARQCAVRRGTASAPPGHDHATGAAIYRKRGCSCAPGKRRAPLALVKTSWHHPASQCAAVASPPPTSPISARLHTAPAHNIHTMADNEKQSHAEERAAPGSPPPEDAGVADARKKSWKYREFNILGHRVYYASPAAQLGIVSFVCFMCPGMFNALSGMGGGGQVDTEAANKANIALYSTFAVVGFFAGTIANTLGVKFALGFGGLGYSIYVASFLSFSHTQNYGFTIFAGAFLGVCAGLLWCAQGAIMMSYPPEASKGRYISWFWMIFNLGAVIGSLVRLTRSPGSSSRILLAIPC